MLFGVPKIKRVSATINKKQKVVSKKQKTSIKLFILYEYVLYDFVLLSSKKILTSGLYKPKFSVLRCK